MNAIFWGDEKEIRRLINAGENVKQARFFAGTLFIEPLRHAFGSNRKCGVTLIDAGANPYECGISKKHIPKHWIEFFNSRNSTRSSTILAMHAMHKTYGKDVAKIVGRVIWELRGIGAISAKKIKV